MNRTDILVELHEDYGDLKIGYAHDLQDLAVALRTRRSAQVKHDGATEALAAKEAAAILAESHPEGKINGKNADSRKQQREALIAWLRENDADAHGLAATIQETGEIIAQADITIEVVKARLYSYQALSRVMRGLAQALAV